MLQLSLFGVALQPLRMGLICLLESLRIPIRRVSVDMIVKICISSVHCHLFAELVAKWIHRTVGSSTCLSFAFGADLWIQVKCIHSFSGLVTWVVLQLVFWQFGFHLGVWKAVLTTENPSNCSLFPTILGFWWRFATKLAKRSLIWTKFHQCIFDKLEWIICFAALNFFFAAQTQYIINFLQGVTTNWLQLPYHTTPLNHHKRTNSIKSYHRTPKSPYAFTNYSPQNHCALTASTLKCKVTSVSTHKKSINKSKAASTDLKGAKSSFKWDANSSNLINWFNFTLVIAIAAVKRLIVQSM